MLDEKKVTIDQFRDFITLLPVTVREDNKKCVANIMPDLTKACSLPELRGPLNLWIGYSYLNYGLLKEIINTFDAGGHCTRMMRRYMEDLQSFRKRTPLLVFREIHPGRFETPLPGFKQLVLEKLPNCPNHTLEEVEQFRQRFACQYHLNEAVTLIYMSIRFGSIVVTWLIPTLIVPELRKDIKKTTDFLSKQQVVQITIDGTTEYEELLSPRGKNVELEAVLQNNIDLVVSCAGPDWFSIRVCYLTETAHAVGMDYHCLQGRSAGRSQALAVAISSLEVPSICDSTERSPTCTRGSRYVA